MTLSDLRSLLALAHGPAVERLDDRTPEGVARAYLPRFIWMLTDSGRGDAWLSPARHNPPEQRLDLTDANTVFSVRVALALALGLDPGPMGCAVAWGRSIAGNYILTGSDGAYRAFRRVAFLEYEIDAPDVHAEPDAVKALVLAVRHVLGAAC